LKDFSLQWQEGRDVSFLTYIELSSYRVTINWKDNIVSFLAIGSKRFVILKKEKKKMTREE
jgi:hypothetical protein